MIRQPLCFYDVKNHILQGGYSNSIYKFYTDILIIFQNAFAFNMEISPIAQDALKLKFIFDRLFYEMVLNIQYPLLLPDDCNICRYE